MAKIIKNADFKIQNQRRYPWGEWMDGKARLAERGVDYTCSDSNFRAAIYERARRYGVKARANIQGEGKILFQFYEENGDA